MRSFVSRPQAAGNRRGSNPGLPGQGRSFFSRARAPRVRMLWSRSASFTRMTWISRAMAMAIFWKFSARFRPGFEDGGELRDAVDQFCDVAAEGLGEGFLADAGILDDVVQQGCHKRLGIHAHARKDVGHRRGMGDVGMAGFPSSALRGQPPHSGRRVPPATASGLRYSCRRAESSGKVIMGSPVSAGASRGAGRRGPRV